MAIRDGGVQETAVKTIPIPRAEALDVRFYPEGGELVISEEGAGQRMYVEARTAKGKPADVAGDVLEMPGERVVASFCTTHEGRGRFMLHTAKSSCTYHAVLQKPPGINSSFPLPKLASGDLRVLRCLVS